MEKVFQRYVRERAGDPAEGRRSLFGPGRDGAFRKWVLGIERLGAGSGFSEWIFVTVPATESGVSPAHSDEQPYGWNGAINEHAAESAVWYAFELATDVEATEFMQRHRPAVIFEFVERGTPESLQVKFNGRRWVVIDDEE